MKTLAKISHGYYQPYFYWMFPILVAREQKMFEKEGIELEVHDIVPQGQPEKKAQWYREALETKSRDFYFCCAWQGIYSTSETGRGLIGAALKSSLIKTFAIYTRPDTKIRNVLDLVESGTPIAVNKNADAHYVTLKNLSEFVPEDRIRLSHLGGVERCLEALISKEVDAATLAGPYAEAAEAIGYRRILPLSRTEPTVVVFNEKLGHDLLASFVKSINRAIDLINGEREKYRARYVKEFEEVLEKYLPELRPSRAAIKERLTLPVWAEATPLKREEFAQIHSFLLEHGLSLEGRGYSGTVDPNAALRQ
jgi:ABC-type nitrate/sulfonate/bicarbonate transport system substrate-binding protein